MIAHPSSSYVSLISFGSSASPISKILESIYQVTDSGKVCTLESIGLYSFVHPIAFIVTHNADDTILLSNETAKLYGLGHDLDEAKADLEDELEYAWQEFILEDDSEFDQSAKRYRQWLMENVIRNDDSQSPRCSLEPDLKGVQGKEWGSSLSPLLLEWSQD